MTLPKIEVPTFEMIIPSTEKKVKYRPFLVKEEKVLLMALEGNDQKEIANAIKQTIKTCCLEDINVNELAPFDIEYFFLKLRTKSIGDTIDLTYVCQNKKGKADCKNTIEFSVNVDKVEVIKNPKHTTKIDLTDTVGVIMKYPDVEETLAQNLDETDIEEMFNLITTCMDSIYDEATTYKMKDTDQTETKEFLDGLTQAQFMKIRDFFETMPKLKYETTLLCDKCKGKNKVEIEGLQNFFV